MAYVTRMNIFFASAVSVQFQCSLSFDDVKPSSNYKAEQNIQEKNQVKKEKII